MLRATELKIVPLGQVSWMLFITQTPYWLRLWLKQRMVDCTHHFSPLTYHRMLYVRHLSSQLSVWRTWRRPSPTQDLSPASRQKHLDNQKHHEKPGMKANTRKHSISTFCTGISQHGLSQHVWVPFWTPKPLKITPQDTQIFLCGFSKNLNLKLVIDFFFLLIIPMTLFNDIKPYFDEFIHVYGWNMSIFWSPLKIWTPQNFATANFRHPVSKSWLRHCLSAWTIV